jgi:hypothetical protein
MATWQHCGGGATDWGLVGYVWGKVNVRHSRAARHSEHHADRDEKSAVLCTAGSQGPSKHCVAEV